MINLRYLISHDRVTTASGGGDASSGGRCSASCCHRGAGVRGYGDPLFRVLVERIPLRLDLDVLQRDEAQQKSVEFCKLVLSDQLRTLVA